MTRKIRIAALLWILALAIALWCIPARAQDRGTITLALTLQNNRYFAVVVVNGEKCNLMIDTGADATIINPKALGPNLAYGQNVTIRGVDGGTVKARQADVTISWSKTEAAGYKIIAGQLTKLGDGILGMDVLGTFDSITLDTKNKTLTLR